MAGKENMCYEGKNGRGGPHYVFVQSGEKITLCYQHFVVFTLYLGNLPFRLFSIGKLVIDSVLILKG